MKVPSTPAEDASGSGFVSMVMVRAAHELVARELRGSHVVAMVGPTSESGWTCVWLNHEDLPEAAGWTFEQCVSVQETSTGGVLVSAREANETMAVLWSSEGVVVDPSQAANVLATLFDAGDRTADIKALLSCGSPGPGAFAARLADLLELPELERPESGVIVSNGDPAMVRMAAAMAGPASFSSVGQGWLAVAPTAAAGNGATPIAGGTGELAQAISTVVRHRDHTLVLWREAGASGVQIWGRSDILGDWAWGGWEFVDPGWEAETQFSELCISINPDIQLPRLRALLRRWASDDPLAEFLELLELPEAILSLIDATSVGAAMPHAEEIDRLPAPRAWLEAVTSSALTPKPAGHRLLYGAFAGGTVLAALTSLAMTALGIAVNATDGTVIDQQGQSLEDWTATVFFALLTAILIPSAFFRSRRLFQGSKVGAATRIDSSALPTD